MTDQTKIPMWFWVSSTLALIWYAMGSFNFYAQMTMMPEMLAKMTAGQREMVETYPLWVKFTFGIGVIGGALGCLSLLIKKTIALPLLFLSMLGIFGQMFYTFFLSDLIGDFGPGGVSMPLMIIAIAVLLVWLANHAKNKGWLR